MLKLADRTCDGSGTTALCWAKLDQIQDHLAKISSSIPGVKMIPFPPYKAPQTQSRLPSPTKTEYSDF